jgi:RimJ/RimL family protein N-acetyltransferase
MGERPWLPDRIEGWSIELRRHTYANLRAFLAWYADPEVARLTRHQDGPMNRDDIERFFQTRVMGTDGFTMAIHLRESGRLIGTCAFSQLEPDNGSVLFHITIGERDCWGRGYGTEATNLMLSHAFRVFRLHRVGLTVFEFNERAIRSYEKVGFIVEGRIREAIHRDGRFWDEIQMGILVPEWEAIQAERAERAERERAERERAEHAAGLARGERIWRAAP